MTHTMPADMESFLSLISTTDLKMRLSVGSKLLTYLSDSSNSIVCSDIGLFVDQLLVWLQCSNYKVVQIDLEILNVLITRMKTDFHPYLTTLLPHLVDRLEDNKEIIREKTSELFLVLVDCHVITLQNLFDKIAVTCFNHKNSNVREHIMFLLCRALDTYGSSSLIVSKLVPHIVKCLSDSNGSVRSTAFDTLCNIYKHVGERLRIDLLKKNCIPANRLPALINKFDEIRANVADDDVLSSKFQSLKVEDEVDQVEKNGFRTVNSVLTRPPVTPSSSLGSSAMKSRIASSMTKSTTSAQIGAVDEDTFLENFEKVPVVQIYSGRDVEDQLRKFHDILRNKNEPWENRVDCLKKIRSLVIAGALKYDEFHDYLNRMLPAFHLAVEDLRSAIVREACITIAFLSRTLENKLEHFVESLLNTLINLIQKSQKVFTFSGLVCVRFILQYTHAPRLIPIIANNLNSKSKEIRRACCEFISLILQTWSEHTIERHAFAIQEAIKKGIADADAEARSHARKAYTEFAQHFPDAAESLKNSLDFSYRKLLFAGSNAGSNSSLSRCADVKPSIPRSVNAVSLRSNSAIDLQAVKRAKTRAQYAAMARQKFGAGAGVASSVTKPRTMVTTSAANAENRVGRTKNRVSISQPSSRSGSPSSRFSCYSHYLSSAGPPGSRSRKSSFGNDTSRETSPNRSFSSPFAYKSRLSTQPLRRPVTSQKILQQSREAETELADALGNISDLSMHSFRPASRSLFRTPDDHSDESETSSMCSEHSFDSFRRTSDSISWNGSQHRLYRDMGDVPLKDVADIVACCESSHWNERKRGLISLQYYIQEGNKLELSHLKRIMEIFLKIFNDPHIKVFSMFLDTLNELILSHSMDLHFCLHLLLTRLFNKLGTDLLNSVHSKIMKTLDNVFDVFPHDLQIQSVFRFLVDPTQTPNNRVKVAALNYMIKLTTVVDPCTAFSSNNTSNSKDYATMALSKMIGWTLADSVKSSAELRKISQEAILSLFNLNTSQVTRRLASMPADYQEIAATLCKSKCSPLSASSDLGKKYKTNDSRASVNSSVEVNLSYGSLHENRSSDGTDGSLPELNYRSFCENLTNNVNNHSRLAGNEHHSLLTANDRNHELIEATSRTDSETSDSHSPIDDASAALKTYIDELSQANETGSNQTKRDVLAKLTKLIQECPSNAIITHFRPLLGKIITMMSSSEAAAIREGLLNLLQLIIKRKTVIFLLKQFSDLIITKVISMCADSNKDVVKAAENCAIVLSTHLPAENVVRIIVPLINTSETAPVKLISIKMLTRLVECSDNQVTFENINQIMPVLLVAYDDMESSVRKAAVFCMVALYRQSDDMKAALEPFIDKLQGAKKKLLELYIERAEQSSSIPTSPKHS